jgi:hypothetical protein
VKTHAKISYFTVDQNLGNPGENDSSFALMIKNVQASHQRIGQHKLGFLHKKDFLKQKIRLVSTVYHTPNPLNWLNALQLGTGKNMLWRGAEHQLRLNDL